MKRATLAALFLSFAGAIATVPAFAVSVLYDNAGPTTDTTMGYVTNSDTVSDTFTLSQASTITGMTFNVWYAGQGGTLPDAVWSIGTTNSRLPGAAAFGSGVTPYSSYSLVAGSVNFSNLSFSNGEMPTGTYSIFEYTIALPDISLGAGTYWISLSDGYVDGAGVYWDQSNGPSIAFDYPYPDSDISSETFQILGDSSSSATPEPSSLWLLGTGMMGLAGVIRSKLKTKSIFWL
jgi:hypothetical protein